MMHNINNFVAKEKLHGDKENNNYFGSNQTYKKL